MDKDYWIGTLVGNLENMVGAVSLGVPKSQRGRYLQERLDQARVTLADYREGINGGKA